MDNKAHIEAANALIQWFNSQEIGPSDSCAIMSKVIAKVIVGVVHSGAQTRAVRETINEGVDLFTLDLIHDINDRLHATRSSGSKGSR